MSELLSSYARVSDILKFVLPVFLCLIIVIMGLSAIWWGHHVTIKEREAEIDEVMNRLEAAIASRDQARDAGLAARRVLTSIIQTCFVDHPTDHDQLKLSIASECKRLGIYNDKARSFLNSHSRHE